MIRWFASLEPRDEGRTCDLGRLDGLIVDASSDAIIFGVDNDDEFLSAVYLKAVMQWVRRSQIDDGAKLHWQFSSVAVPVVEMANLLQRWDETGEPPILSIIDLVVGQDQHVTGGMADFVGYEIAARFGAPEQSRDAARILGRLARHALMNGGLDRAVAYEGFDGRALRLDWTECSDKPKMVTIIL